MAANNIYLEKIIKKEIPATIVYQDEWVTAFEDINPQAPVHILVVPNEPLATTNELTEKQDLAMGKVVRIASQIAKEKGIAEDGYRLIINCNKHGRQEVFHIHLHLLGGKDLGNMLPNINYGD